MIELTSALEQAAATTKPKEKMAAITGLNPDSQKLLLLAQSPYITFGVKQIPNYQEGLYRGTEGNLAHFFTLCDLLEKRELTGHDAKKAIVITLSEFSPETYETLANVLRKDLRANLGTTLINKVYKNLVPTFKCMLADKMDQRFKWDSGPWLVEYKYDGMRILARVTKDGVELFSRAGLTQPKFEGLFEEYLLKLREVSGEDFYLDGEVYADTFNATMESRKGGADRSGLKFRAWDYVSLKEWDAQKSTRIQLSRRATLDLLMSTADDQISGDHNVVISEGIICETREELDSYYEGLVADGAEGVIIKDLNAVYHFKRNRAWTKYKPVYTADLELLSMYEGSNKYKRMLGGFTLRGYLEDGTLVEADCGSGFIDEQRREFWDNQDNYIGLTVEVEYQEVSKSSSKSTHSLRFPVFKHFREDK